MECPVSQALHTHADSLRRYAIALTRNPADADDLVQECLKRALAYITPEARIRDLRAYLFTILHNVHMDAVGRSRRAGAQVPVDQAVDSRLSYPPPQLDHMLCTELPRVMRQLPRDQRRVLVLVAIRGMSYRDAAARLGIPVGTVMSRLSRGREALRTLLAGAADVGEVPFASAAPSAVGGGPGPA